MNDKQVLMKLEILKMKRQSDKEAYVTLTSIEQEIENDWEIWLERLIENANKDKKMLRHMAYHYMTCSKICNMRIRKLRDRLRRAFEGRKEKDR